VVIKNDLDLRVWRLIGQHARRKPRRSSRFLNSVNFVLTRPVPTSRAANRFQRPVALLSALQPADHSIAVGVHLTGVLFDRCIPVFRPRSATLCLTAVSDTPHNAGSPGERTLCRCFHINRAVSADRFLRGAEHAKPHERRRRASPQRLARPRGTWRTAAAPPAEPAPICGTPCNTGPLARAGLVPEPAQAPLCEAQSPLSRRWGWRPPIFIRKYVNAIKPSQTSSRLWTFVLDTLRPMI